MIDLTQSDATAGTYRVHADVVDDGRESSVASIFTAELATRVAIISPTNGPSVPPLFNTNLVAWIDDPFWDAVLRKIEPVGWPIGG